MNKKDIKKQPRFKKIWWVYLIAVLVGFAVTVLVPAFFGKSISVSTSMFAWIILFLLAKRASQILNKKKEASEPVISPVEQEENVELKQD